uniref:Uncharacterized protein n=1 Tax=Cacopsylla melanoneura TaxID=428564 RepID=A0A8D8RDY7_9HEMI
MVSLYTSKSSSPFSISSTFPPPPPLPPPPPPPLSSVPSLSIAVHSSLHPISRPHSAYPTHLFLLPIIPYHTFSFTFLLPICIITFTSSLLLIFVPISSYHTRNFLPPVVVGSFS